MENGRLEGLVDELLTQKNLFRTAADEDFYLEAGETVTINASYSPASASMDFGRIAPDGLFYYINVTSGSINKSSRWMRTGITPWRSEITRPIPSAWPGL